MKNNLLKTFVTVICLFCGLSANALSLISDFEWLETDNKIEIVVGESHQLQYTAESNASKVFTSEYSSSWVHYDFTPSQHVVDGPTGYSIDENGVITGLVAGSYAIKYTGFIQAKSGSNKWLYITVVNEKSETESNNTLDTSNEFTKNIKLSLYNLSDVDYVKYNHHVSNGTYLIFKVHYNGSDSFPAGFKWATFSGSSPQQMGGGSLIEQDQECKCLVSGGEYVYFELYFNQSFSRYFNSTASFTIEVLGDDTGIDNVEVDNDNANLKARKYISNGKLFIERNGKKYDIGGRLQN